MEQAQYKVRLSDGREFGPGPQELIMQWAREGRVPQDSLLVDAATGDVKSVLAAPWLQPILQAPPTVSTGLRVPDAGPGSSLIPTKNPAALVGYYLSVFSIITGPLLGIPAVILGIVGLVKRSRNPQIRGLAHAWVAIILGSLTTLGYGLFMYAVVSGM